MHENIREMEGRLEAEVGGDGERCLKTGGLANAASRGESLGGLCGILPTALDVQNLS